MEKLKFRSPILIILFSMITFGIYGIYFVIKVTDEMHATVNSEWRTPGINVFLFSIITFGIYNIYWLLKMSEKAALVTKDNKGLMIIILLILAPMTFGITALVGLIIFYSEINRVAMLMQSEEQ